MVSNTTPDEELRLTQLLISNEAWVETLKEALAVTERDRHEWEEVQHWGKYLGFEWFQVHTPMQTLYKMVNERVIDVTSQSRSSTYFLVRNPEIIAKILDKLERPGSFSKPDKVPSDLFDIVVGHESVKTMMRYAIEAEKPVHLLLSGPPASAKTLFLMELNRLPEAYYCLAQTTSQAGLASLLFAYQPKYLLIDEIDRLGPEHVGVLNSLMATGIVSEVKYGKTRGMELPTKVFAAGIKINLLPRDLLSRFAEVKFPIYEEKEFTNVVMRVLVQREGQSEDLAIRIANEIWQFRKSASDVRQCVQIARLCGGDVNRVTEVLKVLREGA